MEYEVDLGRVSLPTYRRVLTREELLPGRRMLLEDIDARFHRMAEAGAGTLLQLKQRLSTPDKLARFSGEAGVPADYLVVLKRQMGSLTPKAALLGGFPGLPPEAAGRLAAAGVTSTRDFLRLCRDRGEDGAAEAAGVDPGAARELCGLCELAQINGVGPAFARALCDAGYRSVRDIALASAAEMLRRITAANEAGGYYRAALGEKDAQFVIDGAALLIEMAGGPA